MADQKQSFENHTRFVPPFHFFVLPILLVNVLWALYRVVVAFSWETILGALVAIALMVGLLFARLFALTAQDRVIRLEMRLRLARLLPPDLQGDIDRFTLDQLIGMRFAGDPELPGLARKVLADNIADRKTIKQMVKDWQGDFLRV